jgi:type IV pilus assembly protein PilN
VLPIGVQVTSIEPQILSNGNVMIRLRVSGERDRAVQLVRNLERSKRFLAPRLTGEAAQAKEPGTQGNVNAANDNSLAPPGVEFEILADYNPLPEGELYTTGKSAKTTKAAASSKRSGSSGVVLKPHAGTHPKPAKGGAQ